jgi:hypothetical protein
MMSGEAVLTPGTVVVVPPGVVVELPSGIVVVVVVVVVVAGTAPESAIAVGARTNGKAPVSPNSFEPQQWIAEAVSAHV